MRLILTLALFASLSSTLWACEVLCSKDFWQSSSLEKFKAEVSSRSDTNIRSALGNGMLHWAAVYGGADHIKVLVNHGAEANMSTRFYGETPLFWALAAGNTAALEALVEAGADVNIANDKGMLLLHLSAEKGSQKEVMILLDGGADGAARTAKGQVAFDLAKHNPRVKGTKAYWALNVAQFN